MKKSPEEASQVERCATTGKKKSTLAQARKEARFMKHNRKLPRMVPAPYRCRECTWWHVGNTAE